MTSFDESRCPLHTPRATGFGYCSERTPCCSEEDDTASSKPRKSARYQHWLLTSQILLFLLSLVNLSASVLIVSPKLPTEPVPGSIYAPISRLEVAVSQRTEVYPFVGTLDAASPYKGPPTPEVQSTWSRLVQSDYLSISKDDLLRAGGSETASARIPDELGGGYLASTAVSHQLHCLFLLWKYTYPTYFNISHDEEHDQSGILHLHLDHCMDTLRQALPCFADTTPVTYNWQKGIPIAVPNFSSVHRCRDHGALYEWVSANRLNFSGPAGGLPKPEGAVELDHWP